MTTITEQAEAIKKMGSPLSIEAIVALLEKTESRKDKNAAKRAKRYDTRIAATEAIKNQPKIEDMHAHLLNNARRNSPSSMSY